MNLTLEIVDTENGLSSIVPQWECLLQTSTVSPLIHPIWIAEACKHGAIKPYVILVCSGSDVVGIVPFVQAINTDTRKKELQFPFDHLHDFQDFLLPLASEEANDLIWKFLLQTAKDGRTIRMQNFRKDSNLVRSLLDASQRNPGLEIEFRARQTAMYLDLANGWNAFLQSKSGHFRYGLKGHEKFAEQHGFRIKEFKSSESSSKDLVDTYLNYHLARREHLSEHSMFEEEETCAFFRSTFPKYFERNLVTFFGVIKDDAIRALCIDGPGSRGVRQYMFIAVPPDLTTGAMKKLGAGHLMCAFGAQRCANYGNGKYDLGRNPYSWKERWSTSSETIFEAILD